MSSEKTSIKSRLVAETETMMLIFVYLALLLCAFTTYRKLVLAQYQIGYFQYGFSIFEALILAKVVVIGRYLRVGERFAGHPLIVPTLYKTVCFTALVLVFSIVERIVSATIHGRRPGTGIAEIIELGKWEILARTLVLFMAFVPLFAAWEIGALLGEGKLRVLFFNSTRGRKSIAPIQ